MLRCAYFSGELEQLMTDGVAMETVQGGCHVVMQYVCVCVCVWYVFGVCVCLSYGQEFRMDTLMPSLKAIPYLSRLKVYQSH